MEIIAFCEATSRALEVAKSVTEFVRDELSDLVREIGDAHVRAALRTLSDASVSRRPARELGITIAALQQAYETYSSLIDRLEGKFFASAKKIGKIREKAVECLILIATCYHYDRDVTLRKRYLHKVMVEFDWLLVHVGRTIDELDEEDGTYPLLTAAVEFKRTCRRLRGTYKVNAGGELWQAAQDCIPQSIKSEIGAPRCRRWVA